MTLDTSNRRRRRLGRLRRRLDYLDGRVAAGIGDEHHQRAEAGALRWAIELVEAAIDAEVIDELEARRGIAA